jgi:hypothetical protein
MVVSEVEVLLGSTVWAILSDLTIALTIIFRSATVGLPSGWQVVAPCKQIAGDGLAELQSDRPTRSCR